MERLVIKTSVELLRVDPDDIVFVGADGNYSRVYLSNGLERKFTFKLHYFDEAFQQLKDNQFVRVGKSVIVNKGFIFTINLTDQQIILAGRRLNGDACLRIMNAKRKEGIPEYLKTDACIKLKVSREALKDLMALMEQEGAKS